MSSIPAPVRIPWGVIEPEPGFVEIMRSSVTAPDVAPANGLLAPIVASDGMQLPRAERLRGVDGLAVDEDDGLRARGLDRVDLRVELVDARAELAGDFVIIYSWSAQVACRLTNRGSKRIDAKSMISKEEEKASEVEHRPHGHGGWRPGAGRKPRGPKAGVSHLRRPAFERVVPTHVTLAIAPEVTGLQDQRALTVIGDALGKAADRFDVRIVEYGVKDYALHLLVEAASTDALSRAMQGFSIRIGKGLNRVMERRGRVFADRYFARVLGTPEQVREVLDSLRGMSKAAPSKKGETTDLASPRTAVLRSTLSRRTS